MTRWYEQVKNDTSNVIFSRVRLARNWEDYKFPSKLSDSESRRMIGCLKDELDTLPKLLGEEFHYMDLERTGEPEKTALREERILNRALAEKTAPCGIFSTEDGRLSVALNGDDHIRIQSLLPGLNLKECYALADRVDDLINKRISYAFSTKYGYLTAFPTNVGTAMKASAVVHLPSLSLSRRFQDLLGDMSRFGTTVRGVYGRGSENAGDLYEVFNQKTLGLTEQEILELSANVASQLGEQENKIRMASLEKHRLIREDEVYKSYGVLKYARRLAMKDAMTFLSQLMAGIADGLVKPEKPFSVYGLMIGIQPSNLQKAVSLPLSKEELEEARAVYIREKLPELKIDA